MTTTIALQVSNLIETMATQPPNEVMGAFTREQAELAAKGMPEGVVEVGSTLPDAELIDRPPPGDLVAISETNDRSRTKGDQHDRETRTARPARSQAG